MAMLQPSTRSGIPFDAAKLDRLMEATPRSPCQNGYCERAIGSIRLDCLDHLSWSASGISAICLALTGRTCRSTRMGRPPRTIHAVGRIVQTPFLGRFHHQYVRI